MATRDIQLLQLGALIALLDKYYPGANLDGRILKGVRQAKKIWDEIGVAEGGGDVFNIETMQAIINIVAQEVGIYLQPEWAAKEGIDKSLTTAGDITSFGGLVTGTYVVPAGKTLYITDISAFWRALAVADADLPQFALILLTNNTTGASLLWLGGNGGASVSLAKPIVVLGGQQLAYDVEGRANHDLYAGLVLLGYEV